MSIDYNLYFDCFDACAVHGFQAFWSAGKEGQEAMIAHVKSRKVIDAIINWESAERAKEEARRKHG